MSKKGKRKVEFNLFDLEALEVLVYNRLMQGTGNRIGLVIKDKRLGRLLDIIREARDSE